MNAVVKPRRGDIYNAQCLQHIRFSHIRITDKKIYPPTIFQFQIGYRLEIVDVYIFYKIFHCSTIFLQIYYFISLRLYFAKFILFVIRNSYFKKSSADDGFSFSFGINFFFTCIPPFRIILTANVDEK